MDETNTYNEMDTKGPMKYAAKDQAVSTKKKDGKGRKTKEMIMVLIIALLVVAVGTIGFLYYKEKEKLLKEVKKRFTEIYKKNNFSTRGSAFNNGYNDFVDGVLKGFGSKLFKIEPDEKLQKEMKERRKKEFERKKKEKGE